MHSLVRELSFLLAVLPCAAATLTFHISGDDPGGWLRDPLVRSAYKVRRFAETSK